MTQAAKPRLFGNSILFIAIALLPIVSVLTAGAVTGNRAAWLPALVLSVILIAVLPGLKKKRLQDGLATKLDFDMPLVACIVAGAILGLLLTKVAGIQAGIESSTPGPFPPSGDTVTEVTSIYSVFGVFVGESTGPLGASSDRRFTQFVSIVRLVFVTLGMVAGSVVYLIGFRHRGRDDEEQPH